MMAATAPGRLVGQRAIRGSGATSCSSCDEAAPTWSSTASPFSAVARVASPAAPAGLMSCICQPSLPLGVIDRNLFSAARCSVSERKFWNWSLPHVVGREVQHHRALEVAGVDAVLAFVRGEQAFGQAQRVPVGGHDHHVVRFAQVARHDVHHAHLAAVAVVEHQLAHAGAWRRRRRCRSTARSACSPTR